MSRDELGDAVTRIWDARAERYDDGADHGLRDPDVRAAWRHRMRAWLPADPCDVADLGCGTGSLALLLAEDGHRVVGVDRATHMLDRARVKLATRGGDVRFLVGDAAAPPLEPESVDVVLGRHVLWTLSDPAAALATWLRLVRPGGRLVSIEGRWEASTRDGDDPYRDLAARLPWSAGVDAADHAQVIAAAATAVGEPLADLGIHDLTADAALWGGPVAGSRHAIVAVRAASGGHGVQLGGALRFRRVTADDLPTLHRWLNEPGVVRWWEGDDVSFDAVRRTHLDEVDDGLEHWIATLEGRDVGWLQCYPITASPEEQAQWSMHGVPDDAAGVDFLVGEPEDRGHGLGTRMVDEFVREIVFGRHPEWGSAAAAPYAANVASWRALSAAGFTHVAVLDDVDGPTNLMVRVR